MEFDGTWKGGLYPADRSCNCAGFLGNDAGDDNTGASGTHSTLELSNWVFFYGRHCRLVACSNLLDTATPLQASGK